MSQPHKFQATILIEYRENSGLTRMAVAERLKVSPQFYGLIEKGAVSLPQTKLYTAMKLLKIPANEFRQMLVADFDTRLMLLLRR